MIRSPPHTESEEQRKMMKVLSDELSYFRSFARMEKQRYVTLRVVKRKRRARRSFVEVDLADARNGIELLQEKKLLEEEQSKLMHEPLASRIMNSTEKTNILFV